MLIKKNALSIINGCDFKSLIELIEINNIDTLKKFKQLSKIVCFTKKIICEKIILKIQYNKT